jgi:hypothetical protein
MEITLSKSATTMTTVEIAKQTGKRHDHVMRDTENMLTELYGNEGCPRFGGTYTDVQNKQRPCYYLPKNEVLTLVSGYSIPLRAKIIRRLDELENGKANQHISTDKKEAFELELLGLKYAADILKVSDISRLQLVHHVYTMNGISVSALPSYVEKTRPTFSAKDLLEKNGCGISSIAFNKLMIAGGYMEEKTRSSSKGKNGVKKFKALTEKGLKYGQNDTNPSNPREIQPHYFEDTFMELFNLLTVEEEVEE